MAKLSEVNESTKQLDNLKEEIYTNFNMIVNELEGISMKNYKCFSKEYVTRGYDSEKEKIKLQLSFNDLLVSRFISSEGKFNDFHAVKSYIDIMRVIDVLDEFIDDLSNSIEQEITETEQVLNRIKVLKEEKI